MAKVKDTSVMIKLSPLSIFKIDRHGIHGLQIWMHYNYSQFITFINLHPHYEWN